MERRAPDHWRTVETVALTEVLGTEGGPLLVDCLTLWLTRVMDEHGAWDDAAWDRGGEVAVRGAVEVGQGVVPTTAAVRRFRDLMGWLNARVAAESEDVRWCVAGRVVPLG